MYYVHVYIYVHRDGNELKSAHLLNEAISEHTKTLAEIPPGTLPYLLIYVTRHAGVNYIHPTLLRYIQTYARTIYIIVGQSIYTYMCIYMCVGRLEMTIFFLVPKIMAAYVLHICMY